MDNDNNMTDDKTKNDRQSQIYLKKSNYSFSMSNFALDSLTGLPNFAAFRTLYHKTLNDPVERAKKLVFIYFDVKNFRSFNYHYGFDVGDRFLISLGKTINRVFNELFVSRFSDDHFCVLAYDIDIEKRLDKVRTLLRQTAGLNVKFPIIKAGVYLIEDKDTIINDQSVTNYALDKAKLACDSIINKSNVLNCFYTDELGQQEKRRRHIIETIDEALAKGHIKVFYQPIVHVLSRRLCGYEALARWIDPQLGFLSPADFIPTLEDARLIHRLDTYIIHKVCRDMKSHKDKGWTIVPISVNLSALDFQLSDMPVIANQAIAENNLPKDFLNIEITEAAFNSSSSNIHEVLHNFHKSGFEIWMDNFGSQYSSLNVLREVEVDLIKMDMRFLRGEKLGAENRDFSFTHNRSLTIVKNVVNMCKELGVRTLMEGVEDESILNFLRQIGCEKAQGYLFGKPAEIDELHHFEILPETDFERKYFDDIGKINLLSQNPLISNIHDDEFITNNSFLPLGIAEFDGNHFKFLMSNSSFDKIFSKLGVDGKTSPDDIFNNKLLQFSIRIKSSAQEAVNLGETLTHDFVTSDGFHKLKIKCIASFKLEQEHHALLFVVEQVGKNEDIKRESNKEHALKFLYSLYSRVDLIKADGTEITNIYLNSSRYRGSFVKGNVKTSVENFAQINIYPEDREKFIDFYNLDDLEERLSEVGGDHLTDYFRTSEVRVGVQGARFSDSYSWQMYLLIPNIIDGERYYLSCVRGIDAERMRRLPEINRMGTEYYDMPGNPIFLLLASRAFTSTLGYGSFEQFLRNSFYVEASLTSNKILYMHLGKQGLMGFSIDEMRPEENYDVTIRDLILNSVVNENLAKVEEFFNRSRLLADYKTGKVTGEMEFLRRPQIDENFELNSAAGLTNNEIVPSKPRYLHTVYQLRESNETGDIHAFFLTFDIDAYRRTSESMIELIERDNLTGLYNRGTVVKLICNYLENASGQKAALVILDLDNFKQVNDRFGHDCGDRIIKNAAFRMKLAFENFGLISRIGGDEFLVFIKDLEANDVENLLKNFSLSIKGIDYQGQHLTYTMSIGYAIYPDHGLKYQNLYQNADMALYSVKMSGRNNFRVFSPDMKATNRKQLGFSINQLSEEMPGGFLVYRGNETQEILYANNKLMQIYECETLEEFRDFTNNSFRGCVLPEDWNRIQRTINSQVYSKKGYDYVKYRIKTVNGNIRNVEDFGRLVHSPDDGDLFYVFIIDLEDKNQFLINN